jgi:two-component system sensor histidine kinase QseC
MKPNKSLKARLLKNLLLPLTLAWIVTLVAGYVLTQRTLNQQMDVQLEQIAQSLSEETITEQTQFEVHQRQSFLFTDGKVEFQIWRNDKMIGYSAHAPRETFSQSEGYSQNEVEQKKWRVFSNEGRNGRVMVGQDLDVRRSLVQGMIFSSLWPMLAALPLIALILWISVTFSLKPLSALASAIRQRSPGQLSEISIGQVPREVEPVVHSLNDLLAVVDQALEREKQFADDAAHELRTPLAGIQAQAEAGLRATTEEERIAALQAIKQGTDRAAKMVTQLLALSRVEPESVQKSFQTVELQALVTQVIAKLTPQALAKKIDMGLTSQNSIVVKGESVALEQMLTNLLDNAIRYSPPASQIDICIEKKEASAIVSIEDQGPGIPLQQRQRVFERFVRLPGNSQEGSGIGLAVVKKIADRHHIQIDLTQSKNLGGLKITLAFERYLQVDATAMEK